MCVVCARARNNPTKAPSCSHWIGTRVIEGLKEQTTKPFLKEEKKQQIRLYRHGATTMSFMGPRVETISQRIQKLQIRLCTCQTEASSVCRTDNQSGFMNLSMRKEFLKVSCRCTSLLLNSTRTGSVDRAMRHNVWENTNRTVPSKKRTGKRLQMYNYSDTINQPRAEANNQQVK